MGDEQWSFVIHPPQNFSSIKQNFNTVKWKCQNCTSKLKYSPTVTRSLAHEFMQLAPIFTLFSGLLPPLTTEWSWHSIFLLSIQFMNSACWYQDYLITCTAPTNLNLIYLLHNSIILVKTLSLRLWSPSLKIEGCAIGATTIFTYSLWYVVLFQEAVLKKLLGLWWALSVLNPSICTDYLSAPRCYPPSEGPSSRKGQLNNVGSEIPPMTFGLENAVCT